MMHTLTVSHIPSINAYVRHWKSGKHTKTNATRLFEQEVLLGLPAKKPFANEECQNLKIVFVLQRNNRDLDNLPKIFIDCLEKRYGFNDCKIERLLLEKRIDRNMAGERIMFEFLTPEDKR